MDYKLKKPCDDCPFRRGTAMRLREGRVEEIVENMLNPGGADFPCHKTVEFDPDDPEGEIVIASPRNQHCAGALIFAEKHKYANQAMRFAERFGGYDAAALMSEDNKEAVDSVFDEFDEMLEWLTQPD